MLLACATIAGGSLFSGVVQAQIHPDAKTGHELADKLCSGCHTVGAQATGAEVKADVPSFKAIANKPGQTAETVAGRIVIPHPPMPQIQLTRLEIGDLAAYIMSLHD
jgi:cytochrome c